jgi:hypothetical protein
VIPLRVVATFMNRLQDYPLALVSRQQVARAMKTISMAYSVAVAPPSSLRKRQIRLSMCNTFSSERTRVRSGHKKRSQSPLSR